MVREAALNRASRASAEYEATPNLPSFLTADRAGETFTTAVLYRDLSDDEK